MLETLEPIEITANMHISLSIYRTFLNRVKTHFTAETNNVSEIKIYIGSSQATFIACSVILYGPKMGIIRFLCRHKFIRLF